LPFSNTPQNFIKSWHHEEYYNTAIEGMNELEALLPALEVYASDSGVATTLRSAKDRIQAAKAVIPQAKLKFEAEPLKQQVTQVHGKLDVRTPQPPPGMLRSLHSYPRCQSDTQQQQQ
jgi:hypothetical protein